MGVMYFQTICIMEIKTNFVHLIQKEYQCRQKISEYNFNMCVDIQANIQIFKVPCKVLLTRQTHYQYSSKQYSKQYQF